jgi:hypothetical protein
MARSSSLTSVLGELLAKPKSHSVNLCTALLLCFALPDVSMGQDAGGKASDIGLINPEAAAHAVPKRGYSPYAVTTRRASSGAMNTEHPAPRPLHRAIARSVQGFLAPMWTLPAD